MPLFSVITVTKNNADGFARTKASVAVQDFTDFEWVVIDGDIEPDNGIYDAMNKGLDRAKGDYVIFMNAGDCFAAPDILTRAAHYAGPDFLYGDALEGGTPKPARHSIAYGMPTHHQAMFYRRGDARYDTAYTIAADYKFTALAMRGGACAHLPFAVCDFAPGGVSQRRAAQGRHEQARIRRELGINAPYSACIQLAAWALKRAAPALYWKARSRLRTSRA